MGYMQVIENAINAKLLDLHTAFLAKVISATATTATVQPLGMIKQYGETAKSQAVLSNIPIATHKIGIKTITFVKNSAGDEKTEEIAVLMPISKGDVVICVCCDRDITDAKRGINSTPVFGHHSLSDSVIVGVL